MAGRVAGSKVIPCPQCGISNVAVPGEYKVCPQCGHKYKFTKKMLKEITGK
jgi:DNA-directed RNA polymerase subunit RPC12/RpoP